MRTPDKHTRVTMMDDGEGRWKFVFMFTGGDGKGSWEESDDTFATATEAQAAGEQALAKELKAGG